MAKSKNDSNKELSKNDKKNDEKNDDKKEKVSKQVCSVDDFNKNIGLTILHNFLLIASFFIIFCICSLQLNVLFNGLKTILICKNEVSEESNNPQGETNKSSKITNDICDNKIIDNFLKYEYNNCSDFYRCPEKNCQKEDKDPECRNDYTPEPNLFRKIYNLIQSFFRKIYNLTLGLFSKIYNLTLDLFSKIYNFTQSFFRKIYNLTHNIPPIGVIFSAVQLFIKTFNNEMVSTTGAAKDNDTETSMATPVQGGGGKGDKGGKGGKGGGDAKAASNPEKPRAGSAAGGGSSTASNIINKFNQFPYSNIVKLKKDHPSIYKFLIETLVKPRAFGRIIKAYMYYFIGLAFKEGLVFKKYYSIKSHDDSEKYKKTKDFFRRILDLFITFMMPIFIITTETISYLLTIIYAWFKAFIHTPFSTINIFIPGQGFFSTILRFIILIGPFFLFLLFWIFFAFFISTLVTSYHSMVSPIILLFEGLRGLYGGWTLCKDNFKTHIIFLLILLVIIFLISTFTTIYETNNIYTKRKELCSNLKTEDNKTRIS
jgi:cell division protein FtsL